MIGKLYTRREKRKVGNDWTADRMNSRCDFHVTTWKESVFHQPASCSAKRRSSSSFCWWRSFVSAAHDRRRCTNYVVPPSTCCPFLSSFSCELDFVVVIFHHEKKKKATQNWKIIQQQSIVIMTLWWLPVFVLYSLLFASTGFLTLHRK